MLMIILEWEGAEEGNTNEQGKISESAKQIHNIEVLYLDLLPTVGKPWVEVDGNEQSAQF